MPLMFKGMTNSPTTTLSGDITDIATTIPVNELSVFPTDAGLATIGTGSTAETIYYSGRSATSGAGNLTGVTREYDKIGSYGEKAAWSTGSVIARRYTNYDQNAFVDNVTVNVLTKSGNYTVTELDTIILCSATGGQFTITLTTGLAGEMHTIKKIDSSTNKVIISSTAQIDGSVTQELLRQFESFDLVYNGSSWSIL